MKHPPIDVDNAPLDEVKEYLFAISPTLRKSGRENAMRHLGFMNEITLRSFARKGPKRISYVRRVWAALLTIMFEVVFYVPVMIVAMLLACVLRIVAIVFGVFTDREIQADRKWIRPTVEDFRRVKEQFLGVFESATDNSSL